MMPGTAHSTTPLLDAALEFSRRVPVFPVWGVTGDRCGCGKYPCGDGNRNAGKHPLGALVPNGVKDATTDEATIRKWWTRYSTANIATPTSWASVLDVDPRHGGDASLADLERQHGPLPDTAEVLTGGGGRHVYFAPFPGLTPSAGKVGPGLDIKSGAGAYVLLPPSSHVSGGTYLDEILHPLFETPLAPMPAWLLTLATAPTATNGSGTTEATNWAALLQGAPAGARHSVAARIAGHYLRRLPASEVEEILLGFCARCAPPFPADEARRIVRDLAAKDAAATDDAPSADARPEPATLTIIGMGTFIAQTFPDAVPIVEGILSDDGGGWIGGEEKLGKSWWAEAEATSLALGMPLAGRFAVPQRRRVMIFQEEDSPRRTHRRVRALLRGHGVNPDDPEVQVDLDAWLRVSVWSGFTFDNLDLVAQLDAAIADFHPAVVYIDCLRKVTIRDLNKADLASALLGILDDFRRRYGVIFRLVHHYRKQQGFRTGRGSQEIGGSFVLGAWGENSLFFEPIGRKQGAVRVEVQSKDGAPVPGFTLKIESEGPSHAPDLVRLVAQEDADPHDADELVFQAVASLPTQEAAKGAPGVSIDALAAATKRAKNTVRRSIARLLDANRCLLTGTMGKGAKLYAVNAE